MPYACTTIINNVMAWKTAPSMFGSLGRRAPREQGARVLLTRQYTLIVVDVVTYDSLSAQGRPSRMLSPGSKRRPHHCLQPLTYGFEPSRGHNFISYRIPWLKLVGVPHDVQSTQLRTSYHCGQVCKPSASMLAPLSPIRC